MCICSYALNRERCSSVCFLECLRNDLLFQQLVCQSDGGIAPSPTPPQLPHGDVLVSTIEIYQDIAGLLAIPDAIIGLLVNIFGTPVLSSFSMLTIPFVESIFKCAGAS